jgi:hypothetical protein
MNSGTDENPPVYFYISRHDLTCTPSTLAAKQLFFSRDFETEIERPQTPYTLIKHQTYTLYIFSHKI